uniref:Uncharacterized protein n=1 Tax=Sphenodon punctatus TaxID=8508 RepID=A0A8D0GRQ1_SPHPU
SNRWSFGFAFGTTAYLVLFLFFDGYELLKQVHPWAKVFVLLISSTEVGLSMYPFFACLSTSFRITGAILGLLYTLIWLV